MLVEAIETFKKLSGEVVRPGGILDLPLDKAEALIQKGRARLLPDPASRSETGSGQPTLPGEGKTTLKTQNQGQSDRVTWDSPLFGRLEAPIISQDFDSFTLIHPLSGETVTLPGEWIVSLGGAVSDPRI